MKERKRKRNFLKGLHNNAGTGLTKENPALALQLYSSFVNSLKDVVVGAVGKGR